MAYNTFPVGYQPAQIYYPQQQTYMQNIPSQAQNPAPAQQTPSSSIIWVQGEAGAKSYMVAPNTTVQLWDSENQVIYLKSADASGMPSMKVLDYRIREQAQPIQTVPTVMPQEYVTKEELALFEAQIREQLASLAPKPRVKKEEKIDE